MFFDQFFEIVFDFFPVGCDEIQSDFTLFYHVGKAFYRSAGYFRLGSGAADGECDGYRPCFPVRIPAVTEIGFHFLAMYDPEALRRVETDQPSCQSLRRISCWALCFLGGKPVRKILSSGTPYSFRRLIALPHGARYTILLSWGRPPPDTVYIGIADYAVNRQVCQFFGRYGCSIKEVITGSLLVLSISHIPFPMPRLIRVYRDLTCSDGPD